MLDSIESGSNDSNSSTNNSTQSNDNNSNDSNNNNTSNSNDNNTSSNNNSTNKGKSGGDISPPLTPKSSASAEISLTNNSSAPNPSILNATIANTAANKKSFEELTEGQRQLIKSKLPLLSDIAGTGTEQNKKSELLIKKLSLCATNFDFNSQVLFAFVCFAFLFEKRFRVFIFFFFLCFVWS